MVRILPIGKEQIHLQLMDPTLKQTSRRNQHYVCPAQGTSLSIWWFNLYLSILKQLCNFCIEMQFFLSLKLRFWNSRTFLFSFNLFNLWFDIILFKVLPPEVPNPLPESYKKKIALLGCGPASISAATFLGKKLWHVCIGTTFRPGRLYHSMCFLVFLKVYVMLILG